MESNVPGRVVCASVIYGVNFAHAGVLVMLRHVRLRNLSTVTTLLGVAVVTACSGQIDSDVLSSRVATSSAIAAESQVALAEETATSVANELNQHATTIADSTLNPIVTSPPASPTGTLNQPGNVPSPAPRPVVVRPTPTPTTPPPPTPTVAPLPSPVSGAPGEQPDLPNPEPPPPTPTPEPIVPEIFGPFAGSIPHLQNDDDAERLELGITMQDFFATGTFVNPYPTSQRGWSIGYWLRVQRQPGRFWTRGFDFPAIENRGIVVALSADGSWEVFRRHAAFAEQGTNINDLPIASGFVDGVNTDEGGVNVLSVAVQRDTGLLFLNGKPVAEFDMSLAPPMGDVVPLAGIFGDDEFAGASTEFHSLVISEFGRVIEATTENGLGKLSAGAAVTPFAGIDGNFLATLTFPVATSSFSGQWSWGAEISSSSESVSITVGSDQHVTVIHEAVDADGNSVATSIFNGRLSTIGNTIGDVNSLWVTLFDGHVEFLINGYNISGMTLESSTNHEMTISAFVRGETSSNIAVVTLEKATIWQPAEQGVAGE